MLKTSLPAYFQASVLRDPQRPALHVEEKYLSYQQLWDASQKISGLLRAKLPAGRRHCVGILCEKTVSAYSGLLGAMDSGNIYVPLNPKLPLQRLEYMAKHAQVSALIVDSRSAGKAAQLLELLDKEIVTFLPDHAEVPAELKKFTAFPQTFNVADPGNKSAGEIQRADGDANYAYLLFTSGTTGTPKGVPVSHENAAACIEAVCQRFKFHSSDRFTQFSELSFDVSIADIFLCWKAGACLYIPSFTELMMPVEFTARHQLTVWSSVPTLANNLRALGALTPDSLASLRIAYFCGEALPLALTREWQAAAPSCEIVNFYGPTEAAIFSTYYVFDPAHPPAGEIVPLGLPLAGFDCRIVTEGPAPTKTDTGELLLAGPQVVTGYWNNAAATEKAFIRLSEDETGRVWYRTGDRVSVNEQNELIFHGRCDRQVKIRGYRVELDEVEAVLRRVTDADLVAVLPVYATDGRCEDLVAFCSSGIGPEDEVKQLCSAYLPKYMLPRRVMRLDEFPRSPNGKIDYRLLATRTHELQAA